MNCTLADYQTTLNQREAVRQAITGLENVLARARGLPYSEEFPRWKGARQLLQERGQPMSAGEIAVSLMGLGFKIEGKTQAESVRTSLIRKPDLSRRHMAGKFSLVPANDQETK